MNCEVDREGDVHYLTSLKGPYDGCRMDIVCSAKGEMVVRICDEGTRVVIDKIRLKVEIMQTEEEGDSISISPIGEEEVGEMLLINEENGATSVGHVSQRGDLLNLAAWWLTETVSPIVYIDGRTVFYKNDGRIREETMKMVGESRMDDFYEGREVSLKDGIWVQGGMTPKDGKNGRYWEVEMSLMQKGGEKEEIVGLIEGIVYGNIKGGCVLVVHNWENCDKSYDFTADLLAFQLRFMIHNFEGPLKIKFQEMGVEMNEEEIDHRTSFWLGF